MRGGDLSNEPAHVMGIRFEGIIRTEEGKLNKAAKAHLQSVARLDVNIYLITTGDPRKCMAFCSKWGVPYSKVVGADSPLEIPSIVIENDMLYYYDTEKRIVQNVTSRSRGTKAELWTSVEL